MARKQRSSPVKALLIVLMILMIASTGLLIYLCIDLVRGSAPAPTEPPQNIITFPTQPETEPPETTLPPQPETVVSTATVGAMGDLLMHLPVINTGKQSDGSYNFDSIFQYVKDYIEPLDYAAANLETTLAGTAKPYHGFPMFNCPDEIVTGARDAGFDMMLTSNNHCFDTGLDGFQRTLDVTREAGLATLGTMKDAEEPKYVIQQINGINIGMLSYTYETSDRSGSYPSLNGNPMYGGSYDLINCFVPAAPQRFYDEVQTYLEEMRQAGAEAIVLFIHWGVEYQTYANETQQAMAQKLCDMGVDVIVGGHPHVVQPMDLLTSTLDPEQKTVVIYSLGNAVSNQRASIMESQKSGHTEDGALFTATFEKYSDGKVYLRSADVLPTWVNMHGSGSEKQYNILPLDMDRQEEWKDLFGLNDALAQKAADSYNRTREIVGEGLAECQEYLEQAKLDREQYYHDLAFFPERFENAA